MSDTEYDETQAPDEETTTDEDEADRVTDSGHSENAREAGAVEGITPDQRYVEDPDFVPNPADIRRTFVTTGYGGQNYATEATSVAVGVDKIHTAQQIVDHPEDVMGTPDEVQGIVAKAQAVLDEGYTLNAPSPAEAEAAEEIEPETDADGNEIAVDSGGAPDVPVTQAVTNHFDGTTLTDEGTVGNPDGIEDGKDPEEYVAPEANPPAVLGTTSNEIVDGETVRTDSEGEPVDEDEVPSDAQTKAETEQILDPDNREIEDGDQVTVDNPETAETTGLDLTEGVDAETGEQTGEGSDDETEQTEGEDGDENPDTDPEGGSDEDPADPVEPTETLAQPAKSANKPEWVAYAVQNGWSEEDAEAASKQAIQESFGVE